MELKTACDCTTLKSRTYAVSQSGASAARLHAHGIPDSRSTAPASTRDSGNIHGDRDQRVLIDLTGEFVNAPRRAGRDMKLIKVVKIDLPGYRVLSGEVAGLLQTACKPVNRTRVFGRTAFTQNGHPSAAAAAVRSPAVARRTPRLG